MSGGTGGGWVMREGGGWERSEGDPVDPRPATEESQESAEQF